MPDTALYLYLGLGVTALLLIGFVVSLVIRFRGAARDIALAEQLQDE